MVRQEDDRRQHDRDTPDRRKAAVDTAHTHEYLVSGCRNQFASDHNHTDCWRNFMVHQGRTADTTYGEFYGE